MEMWRRQKCFPKCRLLVDIFIIILWISAILAVNILVKPRKLGFFCDDNNIKYPYIESTVNDDVIVSVTLVAPVVIILLTELVTRKCLRLNKSSWRRTNGTHMDHPTLGDVVLVYLGYFWGYLVLTMLVLILKTTTGQLRPHFLAVCRPDVDLLTCNGFVSDYNCTNTEMSDKHLDSARRSFPSGHSAYAVYMTFFIILYMESRLRTRHCRLLKLTSYAVLTSYALWCSATRVSDHMHHMSDVMAGGLLGLLLAVVTFARAVKPSTRCNLRAAECQDVENNADHNYHDDQKPTMDNTNHNDLEDNDDDEDSSSSPEIEAPSTPTPLLSYSTSHSVAGATGLKASPFILEGNKHKFARKTKSNVY